ncbi:MAG: PmoA family protein [Kiritimatiellia bacterium]
MRIHIFTAVAYMTVLAYALISSADENTLAVKVDGKELVSYQAGPMSNPKGGDKFRASDFLHPVKTPSGFTVTGIQPDDHLHHFGFWWPWKYIEVDGRRILCWELQEGDGIVKAQSGELTAEGFTSKSVYIDRKHPGGAVTLINEIVDAEVSGITDDPVKGYNIDLEIIHESTVDKTLTVSVYRYSGFTFRATPYWNRDNCSVVTSSGLKYDRSNFTRAKWVKVEGNSDNGNTAGLLMMSYPDNKDHPEFLRTWNPGMENGAIFVNFNTVQKMPWQFKPGARYVRKYRVFVYDGRLSAENAEKLWRKYAYQCE